MKALHPLKLAALVFLVASLSATDVDAQRRSKKEEPAPALYPNATRVSPEAVYTPRLLKLNTKLQDAYNADGKEEETIAAAEVVLANEKAGPYDRGIALLLAGSASIDLGKDEQAIGYLKRAIEENGLPNDNHYSAMLSLSSVYINNDRNDEAAALLDRVVAETKTDDPQVYSLQGANLYNSGKYAEAIAPLKKAIELSKDGDEQSMTMLLSAYAETGNDAAAITTAEALYQKDPADKRALMNLATLYGNADQQDKAVALLDEARKRGMLTDANDYQRLYGTYFGMEREKEAAQVIEEGIAKGILPEDGKTLAILAQAHYYSDDIPAAIAAAQKGGPLSSDGELSLFLAQVLGQEDRNTESKAAARQALDKGLKNPGEAWMAIARAEYYSDNVAAAQAAYREAAKDPSTRSQAQKALAQISR
ncbi:tetratricopeptide repeat protein [Arenimonas daejeonensis]|uniref:tetratricopeptide repeat protein n=1 Tax=Arenimonas daejeonensis TaxID=370777 RepID=UPI0011BDD9EE|nr:tetratricopeptide repeat protein [Arenimonas daejeonensis]